MSLSLPVYIWAVFKAEYRGQKSNFDLKEQIKLISSWTAYNKGSAMNLEMSKLEGTFQPKFTKDQRWGHFHSGLVTGPEL